MNIEFSIVSNVIKAPVIHKELSEQMGPTPSVQLKLEETPEKDMAADPTIVVAIINGAFTLLGAIVTGLFGLWLNERKAKTENKKPEVRIRIDRDGTEITIPYGLNEVEQQRLLEGAVELTKIKHIALIEVKGQLDEPAS